MSLPLPLWVAAPFGDDVPDASSRPGAEKRRALSVAREASRSTERAPDEHALVVRIRAGDASALGEIVQATAPKLISFAFGFTRSRDAAEDIVQDVFAAVWHRRAEWAPKSVMAYLLGAVRHRAFKVTRTQAVAVRHRDHIIGPAVPPTPDEVLDADTDARRWVVRLHALRAELDRLTERQRSAYLLRYEQGLTIPQIAQVLAIGEKSAEQLVRRTTQTLRERLRALPIE